MCKTFSLGNERKAMEMEMAIMPNANTITENRIRNSVGRSPRKTKVGILGGTFDPVHNGHLGIAREALRRLGLRKVIFLPTFRNPLKGVTGVAAHHRAAMLRLAVQGHTGMTVSRMELRKQEVSYTFHTISELLARHPTWEIYFIIGMDSLRDLHRWYRAKELIRKCTIVPLERPAVRIPQKRVRGFTVAESARLLAHGLKGRRLDISSSDIRSRVARGRSIRYLVPATVERYIQRNGLYTKEQT